MDKDYIKNVIQNLFTHTGCTLTSCDFSEEGDMLWCAVSTPDSRFLIGRDGEALKSFNHLVHKMIEKEVAEDQSQNLMIDINGYNRKRFDTLKSTAHMLAERARYFKSSVDVDPMSAYERRIIHMFLEPMSDIVTESAGVGEGRHVVIKYKEDKNAI